MLIVAVHRDHQYSRIFRIRFRIAGEHVHCHLFVSPALRKKTWTQRGAFIVRKGREFQDLNFALYAEMVGETDADTEKAASEWTDADWAEEREYGYASD